MILEAIFTTDILSVTVPGLTQWDYGQQLKIKGLDITENVEVHFSNNINKEAIVMQASASGNDLIVDIPNVILEKDANITAYVYTDTGTAGETIRMVFLPVISRVKPADFVSDQTSKEVENWVEQAQEYAESAQANAETVQEQVDRMDDILENVPDFDSYETLAQAVSDIETLQTTVGGHTTTIEGLQTDTETNATDIEALEKEFYEGKKIDGMSYTGKTSDKGVQLVKVQGKTVQNGTPSPDSPVPIENVKITEITSRGKNILPNYATDKTMRGVTYTVNDDKSITISGTATDTSYLNLIGTGLDDYRTERFKIDDDYVVSGIPDKNISLSARTTSGIYLTIYQNGHIVQSIKGQSIGTFYLQVLTGQAVNVTVYPQIEVGTVATEYQPFVENTVETNLTLAEGDTYENGKVTRVRKQVTFDGSSDETWRAITNNRFQITVQDVAGGGYSAPKGLCNRLQAMSAQETGTTNEWGVIACHNTSIYIRVSESVTTVEQLQTWLSTHNLIVEYELVTPTTEDFNIPTIPSYFDFTEVSTDNTVQTNMTWKILADCDNTLKQEELERRIEALEQNALGV